MIFSEYLGIIRLYEGLRRSYYAKCSVSKKRLEALGATRQEEILNYLEEVIVLGSFATEVINEVKGNRFFKEKICHHCGRDEVSRNGKYNGNQRHICKSCRKTFTDFTRSPHY